MSRRRPHPVTTSLQEYSRGIIGGLIFSIPLLFTMEVWWAGFTAGPLRLLAGLAGTAALLLAYNAVAGIHHEHDLADVAIDSVEELGIGLLVSLAVLVLLGRIDGATPPAEAVGKVLVAAMTVAIGVSIGTAQLGERDTPANPRAHGLAPRGHLNSAVLSLCGAVLLAANVAPTEEIVVIGAQLAPASLLAIAGTSLGLALVTLFYSELAGSHRLTAARHPRAIVQGVVVAYAVALASSAALLWFFGRFDQASLRAVVGQTVVLGMPATLGAAAGRLLLE